MSCTFVDLCVTTNLRKYTQIEDFVATYNTPNGNRNSQHTTAPFPGFTLRYTELRRVAVQGYVMATNDIDRSQ